MDSKALLAIVLSFLLFLAWHFYFGPTQTPPPQQRQATPSTTQPQTLPSLASVPPAPPLKVDLSAQKTWTIGDSLYTMKIIAQGARESSFELLKFKEELKPDSPPMQMIRDSAYLPLDVELISHKDLELYRQHFTSDAPTDLKIAHGEPARSIPFETQIPGKVRLTKIFTVQADSYAMDLDIQLQNLSAEKFSDQMGVSFYLSHIRNLRMRPITHRG